jgi:hypothetical protein
VAVPPRTPAPVAVPTRTPAPVAVPAGPPLENGVPGNTQSAAPNANPAPAKPSEPAVIAGDAVQDSVEEVLQQTSAQTLQLSRLEDIVATLNQTLTDLQDEMHAGFAEIRAISDSAARRPTEGAGGESMTQRLDFVEAQTVSTNSRQRLITALAIGQGLLLIILLVLVLADMRGEPTTEIPEATYTTESSSSVGEVKRPPAVEDARSKKKRRRKR